MAVDRSFIVRNALQRAELVGLVAELTEADAGRLVAPGYTVAEALARLAAEEHREWARWETWWQTGRFHAPTEEAPAAALGACAPKTIEAAGRAAVVTAMRLDACTAALPAEAVQLATGPGGACTLDRSQARVTQLARIRRACGVQMR